MKRKLSKKSCHKVEYRSKADARKALKEQRHIGVKRFYKCPHHQGREVWHLTSEER